jgi:hypothetical protein
MKDQAMLDQIRLFSAGNFTSKRILWKVQCAGEKIERELKNYQLSRLRKKIIHASYFIVSKSDFVSQNLIWVQIKCWSNTGMVKTRQDHILLLACSFW